MSRIVSIVPWVFFPIIIIWLGWCRFGPEESGTVYIVRHAEKADSSPNPALSAEGLARADDLAHVLTDAGVDAVFSTDFMRTMQTASPTAAAASVPVQIYSEPADVISEINANWRNGVTLVVGHSNTIGEIAELLGAPATAALADNQYDRLYVVHRTRKKFRWRIFFGEGVQSEFLRYGEATP